MRGAHAQAVAVIARWLEGSGFTVSHAADGVHLVAIHPQRPPGRLVAVAGRNEFQWRIQVKTPVAERLRATAAELGLEPFVGFVGQTSDGDRVAYLAPLWYVESLPGELHRQWYMDDGRRYQHEACVFVSHVRLREHPGLL